MLSARGVSLALFTLTQGHWQVPEEEITMTKFLAQKRHPHPPRTNCTSAEWHLGIFGSGSWVLDHTEDNWMSYMNFLNVSQEALPSEFNSTDIHQYIFDLEKNVFIMNHTIPDAGFSLNFSAGLSWEWEPNAYPAPTPQGFDPDIQAANFTAWRNKIDMGPGSFPSFNLSQDSPDGASCFALKTQMPQPRNETQPDGSVKTVMYYNTFWRELVSPTLAKYTLVIADEDFMPIEPWKSEGYSYRWFRKSVQSFGDAAKKLPCHSSPFEGEEYC